MQPITLEPLSIVALIIIVATLVYSYFKYKSEAKKETVPAEHTHTVSEAEIKQHVVPALTAIIAVLMEKRQFKIRHIVVGKGEETSSWRVFGRQEIMRRRTNLQR